MNLTRAEYPMIGGWWTDTDPLVFEVEKSDMLLVAIQAITEQINPVGFKFFKVINVTKQTVNGFNYIVITEYNNGE